MGHVLFLSLVYGTLMLQRGIPTQTAMYHLRFCYHHLCSYAHACLLPESNNKQCFNATEFGLAEVKRTWAKQNIECVTRTIILIPFDYLSATRTHYSYNDSKEYIWKSHVYTLRVLLFFFSGYLNLNLLKRDEMHSLERRGCFNEEEIYAWDNDASLFEYQGVWKFRG